MIDRQTDIRYIDLLRNGHSAEAILRVADPD